MEETKSFTSASLQKKLHFDLRCTILHKIPNTVRPIKRIQVNSSFYSTVINVQ